MARIPHTIPDPTWVHVTLQEPPTTATRISPVPAAPSVAPRPQPAARSFLRQSIWFVLIGILLYGGVYALMEWHSYNYTLRNRFFAIKTAPLAHYDYVILGASRAAVLDYAGMNSQLEAMTGAKILNLSTLGGGITVNRLLIDYFLAQHETDHVVYFLDSFVFYSAEWNEARVTDTSLYQRAPFDPVLLRLLIENRSTRPIVLGYLSGFYKMNNPDWFAFDISEEEATRFDRTYRPVAQIDRQRMSYLYPDEIDPQIFDRYLAEFEDLLRALTTQGIDVIIVKSPIPERIYAMLPQEEAFDAALLARVAEYPTVEFYDFTQRANREEFFFNSDHLNRAGVLNFYEQHLADVLKIAH